MAGDRHPSDARVAMILLQTEALRALNAETLRIVIRPWWSPVFQVAGVVLVTLFAVWATS